MVSLGETLSCFAMPKERWLQKGQRSLTQRRVNGWRDGGGTYFSVLEFKPSLGLNCRAAIIHLCAHTPMKNVCY